MKIRKKNYRFQQEKVRFFVFKNIVQLSESSNRVKNTVQHLKECLGAVGCCADQTLDLQMNKNVWGKTLTFNGMNIVTSLTNISIVNMNEKRITKKTISTVSFNGTREYNYCFNYAEFLQEFMSDHKFDKEGKLVYEVGCDPEERTSWNLISQTGYYYQYQCLEKGQEDIMYRVNLPI